MGAEFIDYIIADKTVAPFEQQRFYAENSLVRCCNGSASRFLRLCMGAWTCPIYAT